MNMKNRFLCNVKSTGNNNNNININININKS